MRKIIHIDMDCFYAAIEMRDNPSLKNKPIAVGGASDRRGVLCTCNYKARRFGVRSAMATAKAIQLCPDLIVLPPNMAKYKEASEVIRQIFSRHTELIEPLSLDEAFLDVTGTEECFGSATWLAEKIRNEIYQETELAASAGIAPNKFLAKVASDWNKPNGQFTIAPEHIDKFMLGLSVAKIFGVGKVTLKKLNDIGVHTCADLQAFDKVTLAENFGTFGQRLYELSRGIDHREVNITRERKSLSVEHTYSEDIPNLNQCIEKLPKLIQQLKLRGESKLISGIKSIFVKIKFSDFTQTTVDCSFDRIDTEKYAELMERAFMRYEKPVRLLGVGIRLKEEAEPQLQFEL